MNTTSTTKNKTAFTLIELLVVIAIISLLVSILLPSLSKAKEQAQIAACLANLRGIGTSVFTYAGEYDGYPPEARYDSGQTWSGKLKELELATHFQCPAHKQQYPLYHPDWDKELRSYSFNGWTTLQSKYGYGDFYRIGDIKQTADTGLATEAWRGEHWLGHFENTVHNDLDNINQVTYYHNIGHVNLELHGADHHQSVLFYDGHVNSYPFVVSENDPDNSTPWDAYGWIWYY